MKPTAEALRALSGQELTLLGDALLTATRHHGEPSGEQWWLLGKLAELRDEYGHRGTQVRELAPIATTSVEVLTLEEAYTLEGDLLALAALCGRNRRGRLGRWFTAAASEISTAARRREDELDALDLA